MGTAILGDLPGPYPDPSLAGQVLTWNGTEWDLSTGAELSLALIDLSDVSATSGSGSTVPFTTSPTFTTPRIIGSIDAPDGTKLIEFSVPGSSVNYLLLESGDLGQPVTLSATDGAADMDLEIDAANVNLTVTTATINSNTIETQNNKAAASGYASLSASSLVVQNPANATATPTASKIPIADGSGTLNSWISSGGVPLGDMAFVDNPIQTGRVIQLIKEQGTTNLISLGMGTPTETLPGISADGDTFAIKRYLTAATTNSTAGLITPVLFRVGYNVDTILVATSGSVITSYRQWVGLTNTTLGLVATPTTQHVAAISYDSARDGTVFWRTVTCDGTSATITASSVAIAASTFYTVRIVTTPTTVAFYINGTLTNTHTTTLPGNATNLTMESCVTTLTTATRRFEFSRFGALIP